MVNTITLKTQSGAGTSIQLAIQQLRDIFGGDGEVGKHIEKKTECIAGRVKPWNDNAKSERVRKYGKKSQVLIVLPELMRGSLTASNLAKNAIFHRVVRVSRLT